MKSLRRMLSPVGLGEPIVGLGHELRKVLYQS
jgi:hypothetical protein